MGWSHPNRSRCREACYCLRWRMDKSVGSNAAALGIATHCLRDLSAPHQAAVLCDLKSRLGIVLRQCCCFSFWFDLDFFIYIFAVGIWNSRAIAELTAILCSRSFFLRFCVASVEGFPVISFSIRTCFRSVSTA